MERRHLSEQFAPHTLYAYSRSVYLTSRGNNKQDTLRTSGASWGSDAKRQGDATQTASKNSNGFPTFPRLGN